MSKSSKLTAFYVTSEVANGADTLSHFKAALSAQGIAPKCHLIY